MAFSILLLFQDVQDPQSTNKGIFLSGTIFLPNFHFSMTN